MAILALPIMGLDPGSDREQDPSPAAPKQGSESEPMVEILARIAREADPQANAFLNGPRAADLESRLEAVRDPRQRIDLVFALGRELLRSGETERAIGAFLDLRSFLSRPGVRVSPVLSRRLGEELAVAYLRLGEQENCLAHHRAGSCILPIAEPYRHLARRGSENASRELTALLGSAADPGLEWLLNLAAMTLGRYPEGVPKRYLVPPETFASEVPLRRFRDGASPLGVDVAGLSGGAIMEDFDGDGFLDIMASSWGLEDPLRFFRSNGDGTFSDRSGAAGLEGQTGGLNLTYGDYDNDGDADVLVLRGGWLGAQGRHPNSLLRNDGGTFSDVTREAELLAFYPSQTAAWADFDLDGHLDLFVGNESGVKEKAPCQLFRNQGDGTFADVAAEAGVAVEAFVKGAVWGDVDGDGLPDLFLSIFGAANLLYRNLGVAADGRVRFEEIAAEAGIAEPKKSFPAWFWDFDNDGHLDLLVAPFAGFGADSLSSVVSDQLGHASYGERIRLYRNRGDGIFDDVTAAAGLDKVLLAMGANFGDLDNDGYLDAYFGTGEPSLKTLVPNRMFRNDSGRRFQDVTTAGGFGHLQKGHGIAFGDLDNDGDQDIYAVLGGAYSGDVYPNALFINPGSRNRWLTLALEGRLANRGAIGARVRAVVRTSKGERSIYRTVGTGGSFGSSSLQQEIGLGAAHGVDRVEVLWPGNREPQVYRGFQLDRFYRLIEGETSPRPESRRRLRLREETPLHAETQPPRPPPAR